MVSESHHRKIAHQMVRRLPKNTVIVPGAGRPCPRCQRPMQIREHFTITENELRRPFYFRILYRCLNDAHKTTVVSFEEDREFIRRVRHRHPILGAKSRNQVAVLQEACLTMPVLCSDTWSVAPANHLPSAAVQLQRERFN